MRIFLRPITDSDTTNIVKWRNSDKVRSHCLTKARLTEDAHLKFYRDNILTGRYKQYIVERIEEETGLVSYPIATVYLKDIDNENKRCELCIFTSNDAEWDIDGQRIAIEQLIEKAFNEFGIHKLYSYVFSKYPNEVDLLMKAGFSIEATLKDEALGEDGKFEDLIRLSFINNKS